MTPDADSRPLAATQGDETAVPASTSVRDGAGAQNGAEPRAELVEAARDALVRHHHEGFRAAQSALGLTPMPFEELSDRTVRIQHQQLDPGADAALAAVLPLLTPADVPHLEAVVREKVAGEIEAYRAERFAEYGNEETGPRNYDWALTCAADIARDGGR